MQYGLVPEDFGGDTICVNVSAKTGDGIPDLLDMILLQSEVLELTGNPRRPAEGVIIESRVESGRGVTATVLVQNGILRLGDAFLAGPEAGKIRAMVDAQGRSVEEVAPGHAAEIVGLRGSPDAGESFLVVPNERIAREISERRAHRRRQRDIAVSPLKGAAMTDETGAIDLEAIAASQREDIKELNLIVRADVQGSVEAVSQSLLGLATDEIKIEILHSGVGAITTNDVNLAMTTGAEIIGFGVRPEQQAAQLAEQNRITIRLHRVIYELIDEVKAAMLGLREPVFQEKQHGHAEVRQIFKISRLGNIAGCYVLDGEIHRSHFIRLLRDSTVVTEKRRLGSLRRVKDDVAKVSAGMECGMTIDGFNDLKEGDIIEAFTLEEVAPEPLSR
jgi:translation initiation factor IF-2